MFDGFITFKWQHGILFQPTFVGDEKPNDQRTKKREENHQSNDGVGFNIGYCL